MLGKILREKMSSRTGEFRPLSKKGTGVQNFVAEHPSYDGRNVTIAIFDSGVDPGAPGLQVTSEGKPKVVARYDCTGAGNVDTSTVAIAKENKIIGLSGRTLVVPESWKNPSGVYHIGLKNAYELCPKDVQNRVKKEKEEKHWNPSHNALLTKTFIEKQHFVMDGDYSEGTLSRNQILKNDDLDSTIEALTILEKKYKHITPVYDCVVFHDGKQWLACLDTSEVGDLASCKLMGEFSEDPVNNFDYITSLVYVSYSFNVHNNGNILEIVTLCSSQGTNISAIAAGCFSDEPEKNGVAPGAQIISLTITDSRLEIKETESAIVRAMIKVMELKMKYQIEVIYVNYSALSYLSHAGRIGHIMNDLVDKYAITWVAGVGDQEPALSTIGALPKNFNSSIIVGEYSLLKNVPETTCTWSSRRPTMDGDRGTNIGTPGVAITFAPRYLMVGSELNNGKIMSASYVAGAIALLISALKAKRIDTCPYLIKKAIENTALYQNNIDYFFQGHLLQVERAFDYLIQYYSVMESYVKFIISCGTEREKGIHIRNAIENKISYHFVSVEPVFLNNESIAVEKKIEFHMNLYIKSDVPWVIVPNYLDLMYTVCKFMVKIDPRRLEPGLHTTTIKAFDTQNMAKGPVFTILVTIVRPLTANDSGSLSIDNVRFNLNPQIKRYFVLVPEKVSWASLHVKIRDTNESGYLYLQNIQLFPRKLCETIGFCNAFNIESNEFQTHFPVEENIVLEFALAKNWSSSSNIKLSYKLQFNGVIPQTKSLAMYHGMCLQSVMLSPGIKDEKIHPEAVLKYFITFFKPTDSKIVALRDHHVILPKRKIYQLNLSYTLFVHNTIEANTSYITCELFDNLFNEYEYESKFWMLFDSNNQYISAGNAYYTSLVYKLDKGIYTIKMYVRHKQKYLLEKIFDLPIQMVQNLPDPITLDVYSSHHQATIFEKNSSIFSIDPRSGLVTLNIGSVPDQKILSLPAGTCLSGTISYVSDDNGKKVDFYDLKYFITDSYNSKVGTKSVDDYEKTKIEELILEIREAKTNWITKLGYGPDSKNLYEELCEEFGDNNSTLHTTWIQCIESDVEKKFPNVFIKDFDREKTELIIAAADRVLSIINQNDLLAFYGIKSDQRPNAAELKITNDHLKNNLVEALSRKGAALCQLIFQDYTLQKKKLQDDDKTLKLIDELWLQVNCFVDQDSNLKSFNYFNIWHGVVFKNYGRMLKILLNMLDDKNIKEVEDCLLWTVKTKFGFDKSKHLVNAISNALIVHYPQTFRPFI